MVLSSQEMRVEGIYSKSQSRDWGEGLNASLLGCKSPDYFTALLLLSGAHGAWQWEGVLTSSLSRLMEQQSHLLSPFLSSSVCFTSSMSFLPYLFPSLSEWLRPYHFLSIIHSFSRLASSSHTVESANPQGLSPFPWPFRSAFHVPQQHSELSVCRSSRNAEHFQQKKAERPKLSPQNQLHMHFTIMKQIDAWI